MKDNLNMKQSCIIDLNESELIEIHGGDKFMRDLGHLLGYCWEAYKEAAMYLSSQRF